MKGLSSIVAGMVLSLGIGCGSSSNIAKVANMYGVDERGEYIVLNEPLARVSDFKCIDEVVGSEVVDDNLNKFVSYGVEENSLSKSAGNLYFYSFENVLSDGEVEDVVKRVKEEYGKIGIEFKSVKQVKYYVDLRDDDMMFFLIDRKYSDNGVRGGFGINFDIGASFDASGNIDGVILKYDQVSEDNFRDKTKVHYDSLTLANNVGFVVVQSNKGTTDTAIHEVGHAIGAAHPTFLEIRHYRNGMLVYNLRTLDVKNSFMGFMEDEKKDYCMTGIDYNNIRSFLSDVSRLKIDPLYLNLNDQKRKTVMAKLRGVYNILARSE
jgi:hypothetical protein